MSIRNSILLIISLLILPFISQSTENKILDKSEADSLELLIYSIDEQKAEVFNSLSRYYLLKDNIKAIYYAEEAVKSAKNEKNEKSLMYAFNNLASSYFENSELSKSLYYYNKTLEIINDNLHWDLKMKILNNIGNIYGSNQDHDKSFEYYARVLKIAKQHKDSVLLSRVYNNIGIVHMNNRDYIKSKEYLKKSLLFQKSSSKFKYKIVAYNNLALLFAEEKHYDSTIVYLNKALSVAEENNSEDYIDGIYQEFCELYYDLGDYKLSIEYGERAKRIIEKNDERANHKYVYWFLYRTYKKIQDKNNAYINLEKYSTLTDSIYVNENKIQLKDVENRLHSEQIIKQLNKEKLLKEEKVKRQELYIVFLVIISVVFLFVLFLLRHQNRLKAVRISLEKDLVIKDNLRLEAEKKLEEEEKIRYKEAIENKERELALTTLHITHKNQILDDINDKLEGLLTEVKNRIRPELIELSKLIKESLNLDNDWNNFKMHFEKVHPDFFERLKKNYPDITTNELKHCAYIKINLTVKEIARMLSITPSGIKSAHYRLQVKMKIPENKSLFVFIQDY